MEKKNKSGFWVGFLLGGLLGAGLIALMGTKEGRRTALKLRNRINNYLGEAEEMIEEKGEAVRQKVHDLKNEALEKLEAVKGKLVCQTDEKLARLKKETDKIEKIGEKERDIAGQIGRRLFLRQGRS